MDSVDARIAQLHARNASAARLAELGSLALRLEPQLLRALRRRFLPWSDPSAELDLWHSSLIQSRGPSAAVLDIAVQARLRERLSIDDERHAVYRTTRECFADHPELQQFEIELNALPVLDPAVSDAEIEARFEPLLAALRAGGEAAGRMATWVLQAAPRWHPRVRGTGAGWASILAASAILEGRRIVRDEPPRGLDPARLGQGLPPSLTATRKSGVALTRRRLRFLPAETTEAATIDVPVMTPALLLLEVEGHATRIIDARPGAEYELPNVSRIVLRGLLGDGWEIRLPTRSRKGAEARDGASAFRARIHARYHTPDTLTLEIRAASKPPRHLQLALPDPIAPMRMGPMDRWREEAWNGVYADLRNALEFLEDAEVIEVETDRYSEALPWESLPIVGQLVLRALPALPVESTRPRPRSSSPEALVLDFETENTWDADHPVHLMKRLRVPVRALNRMLATDGDALRVLFSRPLALLHIAARGMVSASDGRLGIALPDDPGMLTAREISQLRWSPEMVLLEVPGSVAVPWQEEAARTELVSAFLSIGTRIVVALSEEPAEPRIRRAFVHLLYRRLLAGQTLLESVVHARLETSRRYPKVPPQRFFQIWGEPDARLSMGRSLGRKLDAIGRSVLTMTPSGNTAPVCTGCWIGKGLIVTAAKPFDSVTVLTAARGRSAFELEADRSAASTESARAWPQEKDLLLAWQVSGRSGAVAPLAASGPLSRRSPGHVLIPFGTAAGRIDIDVSPASGGVIRVEPIDEDTAFPAEVMGAPIVVDGECVGIVIGTDPRQRNGLLGAGVERLREAVQRAWRTRVGTLLTEHRLWLDTAGKRGARLSIPGALLSRIDLTHERLDQADLRDAQLEEVTLTEASLLDVNFEGAVFKSVDLQRARLESANLVRARLAYTDASGADFSGADLRRADCSNANFRGAIFDGAKVDGTNFEHAYLGGARLRGVSLDRSVGKALFDAPSTVLRVYIASTRVDLKEEREAARQAVRNAGHTLIGIDIADPHTALDETGAWTESSSRQQGEAHALPESALRQKPARDRAGYDVLILIVGRRHGASGGSVSSSGVELEYEAARTSSKRVLAFLANDGGPQQAGESDEADEESSGTRITQFRERLERELLVEYFDTARDLAWKVESAVARVGADAPQP